MPCRPHEEFDKDKVPQRWEEGKGKGKGKEGKERKLVMKVVGNPRLGRWLGRRLLGEFWCGEGERRERVLMVVLGG